MGLLSAISNAVSGLNANQQNLSVLSQNISNANTPNYSNEVANQTASFSSDGAGQGVNIESITRQVDQFLTSQVQQQTSTNGTATTIQSYYSQIESLLGQPGSSSTLDQSITSFFTAVQDLANTPSVSAQATAVNAANAAASQISGLAGSLYTMQLQADSAVSSGVASVNTDLTSLQSVNTALAQASATASSSAGLLDKRDALVTDIAQYLNVTPAYASDGEVSLTTANGITLLNPSITNQIQYSPAGSTQTFINNDALGAITVTSVDANGNSLGQPAILATSGTASNISTAITGGSIYGAMQVRDTIVPNILSQLDQLASSLRDSVNAISNTGSSVPPPTSYTATRLLSGTSTSQYSGDLQIALLNSSGAPVTSPYADEANGTQPLTLDLGSLNYGNGAGVLSVNNIISAINQNYGVPQNKAEIGNINNVQLSVQSPTVPANGTLSLAFNLNNISNSSANLYVTGTTILDSNGNTVASTAAGTVTSTQPSTTITGYQATGTNAITVSTQGANTFTNGEQIYINASTGGGTVGGVAASSISGYYTVENVTGNSFDIAVANNGDLSTVSTTGASALPPYASVAAGDTVNTASNGVLTATLGNTSTPFYTVQENIATVDANGNVVTSTVSYRVPNNTSNSLNNVIGATSATGAASIVTPNTVQPLVTASLVDANGNPLPTTNGSYGSQQGYIKISSGNSTQMIAISDAGSKQLGLPNLTVPQAGTNQTLSQYLGFNNFFTANAYTATGDTVRNSALNLSVSSSLLANPGLISTATLSPGNQPTDANAARNYTYQLSSGDTSVAQAMAALTSTSENFAAAGGMAATGTTFSQYAGQIIATASTNSTNATNTVTDSTTLLSGFTSRAQTVSGVNLDQELANTVIYQNAYSASTRIITVVSQMFTDLLGIIQ